MSNDPAFEPTNPEELNQPEIPEPSPQYQPEEAAEQVIEVDSSTQQEPTPDQADSVMNTPSSSVPLPLSINEERTWAMLAHLSVLLNLFTGFLGGIVAILIYFIYKDRSRFVAYHAMQSFIFQAITWLGAGLVSTILITIGGILGFLIIPLLCLIPGFLILLLIPASLIYGIVAGVQVNNGEDFRYWQVGDWVREILEPKIVSE